MSKPKKITGIDCDAPAITTIQTVVTGRLREMCARRRRALDWSNPEGVHAMRVASRRLRSALRDFMPHMRKRRVSASLGKIKKVADALGQVRDQDVAILALEKIIIKAPPEATYGIQQLAQIRRNRRSEARKELVSILHWAYLGQLEADFLQALTPAKKDAPPKERSLRERKTDDDVSYREVARATILARLKELEKLSDCLYYPLKFKRLHKMRIAAKRLRYAMELFEQCWDRQFVPFRSRVIALQTSLGELHDCDVWVLDLGERLSTLERQPAPTNTGEDSNPQAGLLWLLDHFLRLRTEHLCDALGGWQDWEASELSVQLRHVVGTHLPRQDVEKSTAAADTSRQKGQPTSKQVSS